MTLIFGLDEAGKGPIIGPMVLAAVAIEEKDREIWIGESRFYLGEDNVVYETIVGKVDAGIANEMAEASIKLRAMGEEQMNVLVDISQAEKSTPEAREIGRKRLEDKGIGKVAFIGLNPVASVIASFIMGVTKKEDMRFFKNRDDALKWFNEDS